ncbi:hypothetical protein GOBAR_AA22499 [Gossypium barbadense]|uniref:Uncharacterized protein n=1 Tax=Gossypium barbadense TaxID=3634 RepID=A0A2P5X4A6_GOSBA|nr:hypothetical protein GOBAR_AA22499 [Gossypium barbadense]
MLGAPRLRSMNAPDSEARPVLGPAGNKAGSLSARKPASKPLRKVEKSPAEVTATEEKKSLPSSIVSSLSPKKHSVSVPSVLRRHEKLLHSNLSLNASCSSDASTDSFHSRASTGRLIRSNSVGSRRKPYASKPRSFVSDSGSDSPSDEIVSNFFLETAFNCCNNCRSLSENQVIDEFGSFDEYIWSFVNHKPIISKFRYPRQVPVKTPKADVISKDLVRRGFRSVGPTVIYSFMQVAGITNDHLTGCFRFQECTTAAEGKEVEIKERAEEKKPDNSVSVIESELSIAIDELSFSCE